MGSTIEKKPHAVMVPLPAQGHINPMMQLAKKLAVEEDFIVTIVNTDHHHQRIIQANNKKKSRLLFEAEAIGIRLVSISDGLPPDEDRNQFPKMTRSMEMISGPLLCKLIEEEEHKVTTLISDLNVAHWVFEATKHLDIARSVISFGLNASYAIFYHAPNLIYKGIIPSTGRIDGKEDKLVEYVPSVPPLLYQELPWLIAVNEDDREHIFQMTLRNLESAKGQWFISNTFYELEPSVLNSFDKGHVVHPIGPLLPSHLFNNQRQTTNEGMATSFWAEEMECLAWLDKQSPKSVIYVAFGSVAILNQRQFEEFALGIEATGRPFLWVMRSDLLNGEPAILPSGFKERTKDRGCLVSWAPQLEVLSHPSIACFITRCGWNSVLESITMGVPLLCWPYFADQFINRSFVVSVWKVGLSLNKNREGMVEKGEVEEAVDMLLVGREGVEIEKRMGELMKIARDSITAGGSSDVNFKKFANAMKSS